MTIADFCQKNPSRVRPDETLREAARRMADDGVGCLVVVDEGERPVGIVTDRDIVTRGLRRQRNLDATPVSEVMSTELATVHEFSERDVAIRRLRAEGVRRIPVIDERRRLLGIFSVDDALQAVAECTGAVAAVSRSQFPETPIPEGP